MMQLVRRALACALFLAAAGANAATFYIDPTCTANGNGQAEGCASSAGAAGAYNSWASATITANNSYLQRYGTTDTGSAQVTVAADNVTLGAYGDSSLARPIKNNAGAGNYCFQCSTANQCVIENLACTANASTGGAIVVSGTSANPVLRNVATISPAGIGIWITGATVTNPTIDGGEINTITTGAHGIYLQTGSGGTIKGGVTVTNTSGASTGYAIRLNNWDAITFEAGAFETSATSPYAYGLHMASVDNAKIRGGTIESARTGGVLLTASTSNLVSGLTIREIWNRVPYPSGDGNAIQVSDTSHSNTIARNYLVENYRGIRDTGSDAGTGGNRYISNVIVASRLNGIDYQSDANGTAVIANNSILVDPAENVGHGIVVQSGDASTAARILNNALKCIRSGSNIQAMAIAGTRSSVELNRNGYEILNACDIGALDATPATSLASWQTALGADATVTGDEALSMATDLKWNDFDPWAAEDFKLQADSPLIRAGACLLATGCIDPDYGNRRALVPPDIGAWQRVVGD
jgi:hypothetical protein